MDWLLVAGRRMEDILVIHMPAVKETVARMDARIMLGLERTFVDELLPNSVVGGEVDVLKELAVEHRIYLSRYSLGLDVDVDVFLRYCRKTHC